MMRRIQCHIPCDPWDHARPCPAPFMLSKAKYLRNYSDPHHKPYILFFIMIICIQWHILCVPQGSHSFNLIFCKMSACGWGWPWAGASVLSWHISSLISLIWSSIVMYLLSRFLRALFFIPLIWSIMNPCLFCLSNLEPIRTFIFNVSYIEP